jgi:hypothetical protein
VVGQSLAKRFRIGSVPLSQTIVSPTARRSSLLLSHDSCYSTHRPSSATAESRAINKLALGAVALGAFAIGAAAIGALAIGSLAVGRLRLGQGSVHKLHIGELTVDRLLVGGQPVTPSSAANQA